MSDGTLDCVLVGYCDVNFEDTFERAKPTGEYSGYLDYLKHNSVRVENRRLTYMQLLNRVLRKTGDDAELHVARLPNLASAHLRSFLHKKGYYAEIVNVHNYERARFIELLRLKPRAVAISTTLYLDPVPMMQIVAFVREFGPDTKIVIGGPYVAKLCRVQDTEAQDFLLESIGADIYVNDSQGELTLCQILQELRSVRPNLDSVANLIFKQSKSFKRTSRVPENNNLDDGSIDWSIFDREYLGTTVQTRTARSCAFNCTFCSHPELAGSLALSSIESVELELQKLREKQVRNVVFIDDTFNVPLPRFKDLCRMMIRNRFGFNWYSFFRCSNADVEAFDLMAQSGCAGVFLGVESGDNKILKEMDKFSSVDKMKTGVDLLNERGIVTFASFIVGFPGETDETVENTIRFIRAARPRFYRAELWYADPLTPIVSRAREFGLKGGAFSWSHNTMDWRRGSEWVKQIYTSVHESTILPVYDFDFWSIPYLVGKGISVDQIEQFAAGAGKLMINSLDDSDFDSSSILSALTKQFAETSLPG